MNELTNDLDLEFEEAKPYRTPGVVDEEGIPRTSRRRKAIMLTLGICAFIAIAISLKVQNNRDVKKGGGVVTDVVVKPDATNDNKPDVKFELHDDLTEHVQTFSRHRGGAHKLMGDGAVVFVTDENQD